MNISADDKQVSQTPDHHGLQFHCVRDLCKTEHKKKLSILVSIPLSSSYNLSFHPLFSDISVEIYFFLPPSLRIFPGNAIIAKVESAKSEAFASCSGKKDHPPDKKRGDMSILRDIRKELFYAL